MTLRGRKVSRLDPIQYQFRVFKLFLILPLPFRPFEPEFGKFIYATTNFQKLDIVLSRNHQPANTRMFQVVVNCQEADPLRLNSDEVYTN